MSGIGSIGGSSSELYQYFRQIGSLSGSQVNSLSSSQGVSASGNAGPSQVPDLTSALEATGVDSDDAETLQTQIQSAVATALQEAQDSGDGSTNLMEVIKSTIESTLQANGIDPEAVRQQMQPPAGGLSGPPPRGMVSPPTSSRDDTSGSSTGTASMSDSSDLLMLLEIVNSPSSAASNSDTAADSSSSSSTSANQTLSQLTKTLQDLLSQLWGNESATGNSTTVVGFLFDQVS